MVFLSLLKDIFIERLYHCPALRLCSDFVLPEVNIVHYGHDSLRYFGSKVWNMIHAHIKNIESFEKFKAEIKKWSPNVCPCRLCKTYVSWVGYFIYFVNIILVIVFFYVSCLYLRYLLFLRCLLYF